MALTDTHEDTTTPPAFTIPVRLDFDAHAAGFARALAQLDKAATKELDRVDFDPRLRELVRVRASQLNGCAYCIDMHTKDARAVGESEQRLYGIAAWRDTPYFSARERAAQAGPRAPVTTGSGHRRLRSPQAGAARLLQVQQRPLAGQAAGVT